MRFHPIQAPQNIEDLLARAADFHLLHSFLSVLAHFIHSECNRAALLGRIIEYRSVDRASEIAHIHHIRDFWSRAVPFLKVEIPGD